MTEKRSSMIDAMTTVPVGRFHAYICRNCGYAELYAEGHEHIEAGEGVEILTPDS